MKSTPQPPYMKTLTSCLEFLNDQGFIVDFKVNGIMLTAMNSGRSYRPDQVKVLNFYRFEGQSNPDDSDILYAIETDDGTKGTLIDAYGVYADAEVGSFMLNVENIQKKGAEK